MEFLVNPDRCDAVGLVVKIIIIKISLLRPGKVESGQFLWISSFKRLFGLGCSSSSSANVGRNILQVEVDGI